MSIERMEPGKVYKLRCGMVVQYTSHTHDSWRGNVLAGECPHGYYQIGGPIRFDRKMSNIDTVFQPIKEITP